MDVLCHIRQHQCKLIYHAREDSSAELHCRQYYPNQFYVLYIRSHFRTSMNIPDHHSYWYIENVLGTRYVLGYIHSNQHILDHHLRNQYDIYIDNYQQYYHNLRCYHSDGCPQYTHQCHHSIVLQRVHRNCKARGYKLDFNAWSQIDMRSTPIFKTGYNLDGFS